MCCVFPTVYIVSHCRIIWLIQREATGIRNKNIQQIWTSKYIFTLCLILLGTSTLTLKRCLDAIQCIVCFQELVAMNGFHCQHFCFKKHCAIIKTCQCKQKYPFSFSGLEGQKNILVSPSDSCLSTFYNFQYLWIKIIMDKKLAFLLSLISSFQCLKSLFYYWIENTNDHKVHNNTMKYIFIMRLWKLCKLSKCVSWLEGCWFYHPVLESESDSLIVVFVRTTENIIWKTNVIKT